MFYENESLLSSCNKMKKYNYSVLLLQNSEKAYKVTRGFSGEVYSYVECLITPKPYPSLYGGLDCRKI